MAISDALPLLQATPISKAARHGPTGSSLVPGSTRSPCRVSRTGSRPIFFPEWFMQTVKFRIVLNDLANDRFRGVMLLLESFVACEKDNTSIALLEGMTKSIRALVHEATIRFETLVRAYYLHHSFNTYAPVMVQFLSVLGFLSAQKAVTNPSKHQSSMTLATLGQKASTTSLSR
ncbi:hypothetical protein NW752_002355 [Fusarium irregulare]|nr:hypothetical protein NW752_002355 [Fusarium irregulare]